MACSCTKKKVQATKKVVKEPSQTSRRTTSTQPRRVVRRILR